MAKSKIPSRLVFISLGIPTVFIPGLILAAVLGWNWQDGLARLKTAGGYRQSEEIFPKQVQVEEVVDGDTFITGETLMVRLIGVDAPNRGEENFEEAKNYLKDLVEKKTVELEYDYYQDDKYGRILAYIWAECSEEPYCENGRRMVNWVLLKDGYAKFVTYKDRRSLKYKDYLLSAVSE